MDRRTALKSMVAAGAGITILQACNLGEERVPIALNNLKVTTGEEDLLRNITGAIIPEGEIPGAVSLEADKFVWVMTDDCMTPEDQERFMRGLRGFDPFMEALTEKKFEDIPAEERSLRLTELMESELAEPPVDDEGRPVFSPDDVKFFVARTKGWTVQGYMQSEYMMTEKMPYALVPGSFRGCMDIDPSEPVNINA